MSLSFNEGIARVSLWYPVSIRTLPPDADDEFYCLYYDIRVYRGTHEFRTRDSGNSSLGRYRDFEKCIFV